MERPIPETRARAEQWSAQQIPTVLGEAGSRLQLLGSGLDRKVYSQIQLQPAKMRSIRAALERVNKGLLTLARELTEAGLTAKTRAPLARSGSLLPPGEFAVSMGWTRQALSKAVASNRVFFIDDGSLRKYPAFFADTSLSRQQVQSVAKLLGDLPGGAKLQFFTSAKASLDRRTPLQAMRDGQLLKVKAAAQGFAER
jgi:hypothetical protein